MSIWNWLFGSKPYQQLHDVFFLSHELAFEMWCQYIENARHSYTLIIAVAAFQDELDQLAAQLKQRGIPFQMEQGLQGNQIERTLREQPPTILLARLDQIPEFQSRAVERESERMAIIYVREHHPLREIDQRVEDFAASLPFQTSLQFLNSMDDAVVLALVDPQTRAWLIALAEQWKMQEDSLEDKAFLRSIRSAQAKLAGKAENLHTAPNGLEWLRLNMPDYLRE